MALIYNGFSSFEFQSNKTFNLTDVELVKMDLLNHIFTKKGERVNMPEFGTNIPNMAFEQLDDETLETIEGELRGVFEYDPRVEILELQVEPDYNGNSVTAGAKLFYVELQVSDNFEINISFS